MAKDNVQDSPTKASTGKVEIMFLQNRSFELIVGTDIYLFEAHKKQIVDKKVLDHPDFKQQASLFAIREV